ncbi:MAG: chemotaxis protein CheA [Rhodobacteraceae bacterium]|nr:chemotaxis protein CheA [Paracoccaceae bacterium]
MVQNNKILTVSYGTFSCTLEGFDDSFDTMKAIAEYFRDLAADDRFFGAEPPQPDAEMMARIAEREISRQVEARRSDEGIVLRAAQPTEAPAPALANPTAPAEPAPVVSEAPAEQLEKQEVRETAEPVPDIEEPVELNDAAAEQAVAEAAQAVDQAEEPVIENVAEVLAETSAPTVAEAPVEDIEPEAVEPEVTPDTLQDDIPAAPAEADTAVETEAAVEIVAEAEPMDVDADDDDNTDDIVPAADSIAAKLQRIRDVVARKARPLDEAEFSEDEHAENFVSESAREISEVLGEDDQPEDELENRQEDIQDDEIASVLDKLDLSNHRVENTPEPAGGDDSLFDDLDQSVEAEEGLRSDEVNILEQPKAETPEAPEATARPLRVRVSKVKKADLEAAVAQGKLEEIEEDTDDSTLSAEDEADLLRELAAVEAEAASEQAQDIVEQDAEQPAPETAPGSSETRVAEDTNGSDVSRLLDAADEKLDAPEVSSNRENYNQLRAAVAAAEAERAAGGSIGTHPDTTPYVDDLASVVRPRRPVAATSRAERPSSQPQPAPLKLVAEQRIDTPVENKGPIRPRRIRTQVEDNASGSQGTSDGGFAAFAREQGAVELPEVLEAAAAYMSFVEGRDQFTRPQLMNKARQLNEENRFSREDGLRSFGQLLREGKIAKASSGQFTATGDIGYQPERAAG